MYSLLHPLHLMMYITFLALQFMLLSILNGILPFLNMIGLVVVIRGHVPHFCHYIL